MPTFEQEKTELVNRIKSELRRLYIPGNIRGFDYLTYMLSVVVPHPDQLILVTKNLYPDTARAMSSTCSRVERASRVAISVCWLKGGRETLDQMACHHLDERPSVTQFLNIVGDYIRRTS